MIAECIRSEEETIADKSKTKKWPVKTKTGQLQIIAREIAPDQFCPTIENFVREIHLPNVIGDKVAVECRKKTNDRDNQKNKNLEEHTKVRFIKFWHQAELFHANSGLRSQ